MTELTHFTFRHYQLPVTIIWRDPEESFVRGMKILLKDIEENGIERWNVTSSTEEIKDIPSPPKPVDYAPEEDDCCPVEDFEV